MATERWLTNGYGRKVAVEWAATHVNWGLIVTRNWSCLKLKRFTLNLKSNGKQLEWDLNRDQSYLPDFVYSVCMLILWSWTTRHMFFYFNLFIHRWLSPLLEEKTWECVSCLILPLSDIFHPSLHRSHHYTGWHFHSYTNINFHKLSILHGTISRETNGPGIKVHSEIGICWVYA